METYEVAVIGAGLIGSAAAKYASEDVNRSILIGPDRPFNGVHAAWFDEGRITRKIARRYNWRVLAEKSIDRYRDIEALSGVQFYHEVGFLAIGPNEQEVEGVKCHRLGKFDPLKWPGDCRAIFQPQEAGHISPRKMIQAQQILAKKNNCHIRNDVLVTKIERLLPDGFILTMSDGSKVQTKKVVLAPGAYVNINSLIKGVLPEDKRGLEPDLKLTTQTVSYLQVSAWEAERLRNMPTVVTDYAFGKLDGTYILPPILYPDGKYYLKLGHGDHFESIVQTPEQMENWYQNGSGDPEAVQMLAAFITQQFIPDLQVISVHGGCCVTSNTPEKKAPFIDEIVPGLVLVCGGCGYGAKSSDEIGRIGAKLCTSGDWTIPEIPKSDMQIKWTKVA